MLIYRGGEIKDFLQLHDEGIKHSNDIVASIPYSILDEACEDFFNKIISYNATAEIYFRIDCSIPFSPQIIDKFSTEKISFKGILEHLHAKVIWWRGWGVYIGSSNLTNRSCFINHEAGFFLYEEDKKHSNIIAELGNFFLDLNKDSVTCNSKLIEKLNTQYAEIDKLRKHRASLSDSFMSNLDGFYIK